MGLWQPQSDGNAIKKELPNCSVKHKLDWPFSAHVSINGVKGKRECGPFMFFLPCGLATACCDATVTGKNAKELADKVGDAGPPAVAVATKIIVLVLPTARTLNLTQLPVLSDVQ